MSWRLLYNSIKSIIAFQQRGQAISSGIFVLPPGMVLPGFPHHTTPHSWNQAHNSHTWVADVRFYWRFRGVLLMGGIQWQQPTSKCRARAGSRLVAIDPALLPNNRQCGSLAAGEYSYITQRLWQSSSSTVCGCFHRTRSWSSCRRMQPPTKRRCFWTGTKKRGQKRKCSWIPSSL